MNAFTMFLKAQCEGRFQSPGDLAYAAGIGRSTAYRLLNETRPRLPKVPSSDVLKGLSIAFPEIGLDRIQEIAREATRKTKPTPGPVTRADLTRAHTHDLLAEIESRSISIVKGNHRRGEAKNSMIKEVDNIWSMMNESIFIVIDKHLGEHREKVVDECIKLWRENLRNDPRRESFTHIKTQKNFLNFAEVILTQPGSLNARETEKALKYFEEVRLSFLPILENSKRVRVTAEAVEDEPMLDTTLNGMVEIVRNVGDLVQARRSSMFDEPETRRPGVEGP